MAKSYVRTTISISGELKARMDAVDAPINWSAVAAKAFEEELAKIIQIRGARDMKEVVDRLRASKRRSTDEHYLRGRRDGEAWAKNEAQAEELERLEKFREINSQDLSDFADWFEMDVDAPLDHGGHVAAAIHEEIYTDVAAQLADSMFGEYRTNDLVRGFVDGALDVWSEVKHHL